MALDTKQKRGSAVGLGLPYRQWFAEPDGSLSVADRLGVLRYGSAVAPSAPSTPAGVGAATVFVARRGGRVFKALRGGDR